MRLCLGKNFYAALKVASEASWGWIGWGRGSELKQRGRVLIQLLIFQFATLLQFLNPLASPSFQRTRNRLLRGWSNQHEQVLFYTPTPSLCSLLSISLIHLQSVPPNHPFSASDETCSLFSDSPPLCWPCHFFTLLESKDQGQWRFNPKRLRWWGGWSEFRLILKCFTLAPVSLMFFFKLISIDFH